ncbi:MAG: hypothetical protein AAF585_02030 [Verrucomicrobiota bacterium]
MKTLLISSILIFSFCVNGHSTDELRREFYTQIPTAGDCEMIIEKALFEHFQKFFSEEKVHPAKVIEADILMYSARWNRSYKHLEEVAILWAKYEDAKGDSYWLLGSFLRFPHSRLEEETIAEGTMWCLQADNVDFTPDPAAPHTVVLELESIGPEDLKEMLELATGGGSDFAPDLKTMSDPERFELLQVELFLKAINERVESPISPELFREYFFKPVHPLDEGITIPSN